MSDNNKTRFAQIASIYKMIDKTDWKILDLLQKQARLTYGRIAKQVHLTPPAVSKRIQALEDNGIITGYHASLSLEEVGLPISSFVKLFVPHHRESNFLDFLDSRGEILECHVLAGEGTYLLRVATRSINHLDSFLNSLRAFGQSESFIVLSTICSHNTIKGTDYSEIEH